MCCIKIEIIFLSLKSFVFTHVYLGWVFHQYLQAHLLSCLSYVLRETLYMITVNAIKMKMLTCYSLMLCFLNFTFSHLARVYIRPLMPRVTRVTIIAPGAGIPESQNQISPDSGQL